MTVEDVRKFVTLSLFTGSMMMGQETIDQLMSLAFNYIAYLIAPDAVAFVADDDANRRDFLCPIIKAKFLILGSVGSTFYKPRRCRTMVERKDSR